MLFKKLILFSLLLFAAEQAAYHSVLKRYLPAFWGNEELYTKTRYVHDHPEINTVFIGSSKVKTQILPFVFDSVTEKKTKSFNLGCNGLFIPESFSLVDHLLDNSGVKTIFFELRPVYHIYKQNLHISRSIYYHTVSSYINILKNTYYSNLPLSRKISAYTSFSIAEAENLVNFNFADGYISFKNFDIEKLNKEYDFTSGCIPRGRGQSEALKMSHAELDSFAAISMDYMSRYRIDSFKNIKCNKIYLAEMERLIKKATDKKVKLLLIFPPGLREFEYLEILPLLRELSSVPQFVMTDASLFPELYDLKNNYEIDHLNFDGSQIYSTELAEAYNKLQIH